MVARGTINYVSRETIPQNQCDSAGLARFVARGTVFG
jgi:hypothetical protein